MSKYDWLYGMQPGDSWHVLPPEGTTAKQRAKQIRDRVYDSERLKGMKFSIVIHPAEGVIVHRKT